MAKNREYFDNNVIMGVEVEYADGGRCWENMKGSEVKVYCEKVRQRGNYISDIDYVCKQTDAWVRKVLNTAEYNWSNNWDWVQKKGFTSLYALVDYIIDNQLVA